MNLPLVNLKPLSIKPKHPLTNLIRNPPVSLNQLKDPLQKSVSHPEQKPIQKQVQAPAVKPVQKSISQLLKPSQKSVGTQTQKPIEQKIKKKVDKGPLPVLESMVPTGFTLKPSELTEFRNYMKKKEAVLKQHKRILPPAEEVPSKKAKLEYLLKKPTILTKKPEKIDKVSLQADTVVIRLSNKC